MTDFIYADNAATTKLDIDAFEAMKPYLLDEYGNASQPYSFARTPKKALREARETIASCINANPDEIFFTSGGTESDNWVIVESALNDMEKRTTITSCIEHHAVLNACASIERLGYPVAYLPVSSEGLVSPKELESVMTDRTRLVSIMLANNEIGTIEPIADLASITHSHGAFFHTDAVQAVGHIEIDVKQLGIDYLSASAHKFNGPKGIGFLYVRSGAPIHPYHHGGVQESRMRAGTEDVASIVGMAVALRNNCNHLNENKNHITELEKQFETGLNNTGIDYIRNGAKYHLPGNISISINGADGEAILHRMDLMGICISTGSACDSVNTQISHVIKSISVPIDYATGTIRISLGTHNTKDDVEMIIHALIKSINL